MHVVRFERCIKLLAAAPISKHTFSLRSAHRSCYDPGAKLGCMPLTPIFLCRTQSKLPRTLAGMWRRLQTSLETRPPMPWALGKNLSCKSCREAGVRSSRPVPAKTCCLLQQVQGQERRQRGRGQRRQPWFQGQERCWQRQGRGQGCRQRHQGQGDSHYLLHLLHNPPVALFCFFVGGPATFPLTTISRLTSLDVAGMT